MESSILHSFVDAWKVLTIFLIPVGGGIPAGVLFARAAGLGWPIMMGLYFISDVILALLFEPFIRLFKIAGKHNAFFARLGEAFQLFVKKSTAHYGNRAGPLALILIAFSVDPMTGRAAASAAGHGFISGWLVAIAGDMIYFSILMISTLWLNNILGDGTTTMLIILAVMMILPVIIRRFRRFYNEAIKST